MSSSQIRSGQPISFGLGKHFTSPVKKRNRTPSVRVIPAGHATKHRRLLEKVAALKAKYGTHPPAVELKADPPAHSLDRHHSFDMDVDHSSNSPSEVDDQPIGVDMAQQMDESPVPPVKHKRRIVPNASSHKLYDKWAEILPTLVDPLLAYITRSVGTIIPAAADLYSNCIASCTPKSTEILCLHFNYFKTIRIQGCDCPNQSVKQLLVANGLFPTAPTHPRMAISIDLLDFYQALFERSCDAVNAMAAGLNTFYGRRGFILVDKKGELIQDAFRRGLGYAIQWYDNLQRRLEKRVDSALEACDQYVQTLHEDTINNLPNNDAQTIPTGSPPMRDATSLPACTLKGSSADETLTEARLYPTQCSRILQQRCPACFGGTKFGRSFQQGADFQNCVDGNFNHRHLKTAGQCPKFYDPSYMIPKEYVDAIGDRIESVRKQKPKPYKPKVPDEAVNGCEEGHEAGDGKNQKTCMDRFDIGGLMFLVCRHDIPLFCANIDTPGEQQKYAVALLEHFFTMIPPESTVANLYDVGCVLDRSLNLYDILPESITQRLMFATSAMHAYGHQWACQLVYNPRLRQGFGLTDGEGVERLWSRFRKLIGITRASALNRRDWILDRQAAAIGAELKDDLGTWIHRRLQKGVMDQSSKAERVLRDCGVDLKVLRQQWELQRESQLSLRAHAPARLKKELDTVLALQGDLDTVERAIQSSRNAIVKCSPSLESLNMITSLERTHEQLIEKVESLYASLNVHEAFPELQGINLDFVRTLIMARDLKINIRKRAIGSFFEWDKLDQAVGGKEQAIGTKLHQHTRKAIAKRKPALMTAIRKFNKYCERLEMLYDTEWNIPLPEALPTQLAALRNCPHLMEDIWITPTQGKIPQWLEDANVREGIRAMLKLDRCLEERRRLGIESDNMCHWFGRELGALELALRMPSYQALGVPLRQRRDHLLHLKTRWTNPLVSASRFDFHVSNAVETSRRLTGISGAQDAPLIWTQPFIIPTVEDQDDCEDGEILLDIPDIADAEQTLMSDILTGSNDYDTVDGDDDDGDGDDTAIVVSANFIWLALPSVRRDVSILDDLESFSLSVGPPTYERTLFHNGVKITFHTREFNILTSPTAYLNDVCINGGAALLQFLFAAETPSTSFRSQQCALLSTFDLPRVRYKASDENLWRNTQHCSYWSKDIWILPIHRPQPHEHWVLCIVTLSECRLSLFDSLAGQAPWKREIQDIMSLVSRLVAIANRKGHPLPIITKEGWTAQPITTAALQTNGHDCGLWVLACIGAVLRGFNVTGLHEHDMTQLRGLLHKHILALPIHPEV